MTAITLDTQSALILARIERRLDTYLESTVTKPHEMTHRPDCPQTGTTSSRVGSWTVTRCNDCKATAVRRTEPEGEK